MSNVTPRRPITRRLQMMQPRLTNPFSFAAWQRQLDELRLFEQVLSLSDADFEEAQAQLEQAMAQGHRDLKPERH